jgi:PiT family inorganic phosphate transporter
VVSTRVLTPRVAVVWAAIFNFIAFLVFQTHVANTVGKTVDPDLVSDAVVFAGLVGAIGWNFLTWWFGLPPPGGGSPGSKDASRPVARYR